MREDRENQGAEEEKIGDDLMRIEDGELRELCARIAPADQKSMEGARERWKTVGKPLLSLGKLEDAVIRMAGIKGTPEYTLDRRALVIFCADNGVTEEGVTQTGSEVTAIVAENFTRGAASVCLMAETSGTDIFPVDIGMFTDVPAVTRPEYKIAYGTANMTREPAMSRAQTEAAIRTGICIAGELADRGYEILATGEMGIGNTTTSSAVVSVLLGKEPEEVTGRGAGLSSEGLTRKIRAIKTAVRVNRPDPNDVIDVLSKVGGLDIAGLTGMFLGGAIYHIPVIIDGFISSAAALCASRIAPEVLGYMLPSHCSGEPAGGMVLEALGLSPMLDCGMSLGEGSGAVAVIPLLEMGVNVYRRMRTFDEIQVEQYVDFKFSQNTQHLADHACMNQADAGCSEGAPEHEQSACVSRKGSA